MSESKILLLAFAVLSPFKFRGVVIKPPAFIALGDEEKQQFIDAGVIDPEPVEVPTDAEVAEHDAAEAADAAALAAGQATAEFQGADNAHAASQANDGSSDTAAATDRPGNDDAAPGGERPAGSADAIALNGSDKQPALIGIGKDQVQLGTVVAAAFQRSGLATAEEWNALPSDDREARIAAEVKAMRQAAKEAKKLADQAQGK